MRALDGKTMYGIDARGAFALRTDTGNVLFVPGTILYFWARREQKLQLFTTTAELVIFAITVIAGLVGFYGLTTGLITP